MGQGKRILWIDAVKIAALLIVLCNHAGLSLGWGTYFGGMFYVAVFFVLSGCTYRCEAEKPLRAVIGKRARRLLLPYFGFNAFLLLFFGGKAALTGQAFPWGRELLGILYSRSYLYADGQEGLMGGILNGPTWFLTGLFTALTGYEIAVRLAAGRRRVLLGILLGCIALALALQRLPVLLPWSLDTMFLHMALIGLGNFLGQGGMEKAVWLGRLSGGGCGIRAERPGRWDGQSVCAGLRHTSAAVRDRCCCGFGSGDAGLSVAGAAFTAAGGGDGCAWQAHGEHSLPAPLRLYVCGGRDGRAGPGGRDASSENRQGVRRVPAGGRRPPVGADKGRAQGIGLSGE